MPTRLNQILGVERGVRDRAEATLVSAKQDVTKDGPLSGIARTYQPRKEDGEQYPDENNGVQLTVADILGRLAKDVGRHWDVTATKDKTNTSAMASILIDGQPLVADVPAGYLVWLEKQLREQLRPILVNLPVLNPAEVWHVDEATGFYRSEPAKTVRPKKVVNFQVVYEATEYHPAQVVQTSTDEPEGDWTTTKFSGAIFETRRRTLVERIDQLIDAVTFARESANQEQVQDMSVGGPLFAWLFAD